VRQKQINKVRSHKQSTNIFMQSLIIIAEKNQGLEHVAKDTKLFPLVNAFDLLVVEPDPSIGIDAIRAVQSFLLTPPIKSEQKRVVVMDAHTLTIEAQNSMLKMLEEPQAYAQLVLITSAQDLLLATIQSRCQIIKLEVKPAEIEASLVELARIVETATLSEKIALVQTHAKNKLETQNVIEGLLRVEREALVTNKQVHSVTRIESLLDALIKLKANTNNRMLLEDIFFAW
jgi:DNA polymerase-3 subunit delta'